jgi:GTP-binding protein
MEYTEEQIQNANHLFSGECKFIAGSTAIANLPVNNLPEIAFAGASNVGKSSIVNALTGRRTLVRTSHNPGHTKQLNFFKLREALVLVDLPGYGYARASKASIEDWTGFTRDYLRGRHNLKRICLLIDSRRDLKPGDVEIMKLMDECAVVYQIILTKVDKIKKDDVEKIISAIKASAKKHTAMHPEIIATSSREGYGIETLRAELAMLK